MPQTYQRTTLKAPAVSRMLTILTAIILFGTAAFAQGTRLLRQPTISDSHIVFAHGGDLWIAGIDGQAVRRLTSTPAVESDPHLSPDGKLVAFTSNRSGVGSVHVLPIEGGTPTQLTWYPANSKVRGWTPDGGRILYATSRETAPTGFDRLWTVSKEGGPSQLVTRQWGTNGCFSSDGSKLVIDQIARWDVEWRGYRGGQNTPLILLDLKSREEKLLPNDRSTDLQPLWLRDRIYFISDRDWTANIWSFCPASNTLDQVTHFKDTDIKWLSGYGSRLVFERDGFLSLYDLDTRQEKRLEITVHGDFPWAEARWEEVNDEVASATISPSGKRVLMEARGEIFTIPVENGDTRNLTASSNAADRAPIWSPKGDQIAWFSDSGYKGYQLMLSAQDGMSKPRAIPIGESKMAWEPTWSPDGRFIAFVDDDVRIRVVELASGLIVTADVGGNNLERGGNGLTWSPDSRWLAYAKTAPNNFRRIVVWSQTGKTVTPLTDPFADAFSPAWDRNGKHLYFLASTDVALASGWANTSSMQADPTYGAYLINLKADESSPFKPKSDEEAPQPPKEEPKADKKKAGKEDKKADKPAEIKVVIDFTGLDRRILPLPIPVSRYQSMIAGPEGSVFIVEQLPSSRETVLQKFSLESRKSEEFIKSAASVVISADGKTLLFRTGKRWMTAGTATASPGKPLSMELRMRLDRPAEWKQIFEEAWRYQRDYFYDPGMHGRDWDLVYKRYAPLIPYVRHRTDLNYVLDMCNGELSVGHSFVFGGDFPQVDRPKTGLLGADLIADQGRWKIDRIYTTESWNPGLAGPLDQPGLKVKTGQYIVGVNGCELTALEDPFRAFDGTADVQTVIHCNDQPSFAGAWAVTVKPIRSEASLRQRTWVEDNRRTVDRLSGGKLAYIWVPNTGNPGFDSFNRYYFAQQDKAGAVIDERFNGGGLLDDYMVDLMTRTLRAGLTNEVPGGMPFALPAGILGPKVLLINEMAGSGGDFFPWVFRQQKVGPLIGRRTWGGLVKSSVHYAFVDGGAMTAPDNAVFDPHNNKWVAENEGVPPDIEVRQDAGSLAEGRDAQLERAVQELLRALEKQGPVKLTPPPFSRPAKH